MSFRGSPSGFTSSTQAETIAEVLDFISKSDAYSEEDQATAKKLASTIRQYIKEEIILTKQLTYSTKTENMLNEAFEIYVEAKKQ